MNKKVLVAGGAGYIGSFIVRDLVAEGFEVVIVDNLSSGHKDAVKDFKLVELDLLTDFEKLNELFKKEKFDAVIHMASYIQMGESFKNTVKYFENNLISFINLSKAMVKNNVSKIVFSSSAGVYGNPTRVPIIETDDVGPTNPYGETKLEIERMLQWLDKAHEIKSMSIRYFNASGAALDGSIGEDHPEESHLIPLMITKAMNDNELLVFGDDYDTPDGTCVRDYIHVLDLSKIHVIALKKLFEGSGSNIVNAGLGQGYSILQTINLVKKITGLNVNYKVVDRRVGDAGELYASNEKIKKLFKWKPKYNLEDIIKSAYLWHTKNPKGYQK